MLATPSCFSQPVPIHSDLEMLSRAAALLQARKLVPRRSLATSFAELYRNSVESAPLRSGDILKGHVVGRRRPRSSSSLFYIVDFGLKSEAPFTAKEIPEASSIGDEVSMPLLALEDDFNEPVFDYEGRAGLPALQAERLSLLTKAAKIDARMVHGRFAGFKKGGASVKVLGTDAFSPRHHVLAIDRPVLGSYAPFYLMSVAADKRVDGNALGLDINPVVSSYGGFLFCIANLVGMDDAWKQSGGGSAKERLAYLRLLTRLLSLKNSAVRRILPKSAESGKWNRPHRRLSHSRHKEDNPEDAAWLNDLPQGDWASSGAIRRHDSKTVDTANIWNRLRRPTSQSPQQRAKMNDPRAGRGQSKFSPRNVSRAKPIDEV